MFLCLDIVKGLIPFFLLNLFFDNIGLLHTILLCHFAILGHIFPFWLKFKGGKGIATYIGFLFGINLFLGLSFITIWMVIAFIIISVFNNFNTKNDQATQISFSQFIEKIHNNI